MFHSNGTGFLLSQIISLITVVSIIDARACTRGEKMEAKDDSDLLNKFKSCLSPRKANCGNEVESCEKLARKKSSFIGTITFKIKNSNHNKISNYINKVITS